VLARIDRVTVGMVRKEIEPVTAAQFMRWLLRWQHVAPGAQSVGERGTLEVLQQLQGFEVPANAWERQLLSRRVTDYDPKWLDQLCLTGAVGGGRLSPHPATLESSGSPDGSTARQRGVIPTSVAPVTFFLCGGRLGGWDLIKPPFSGKPGKRGGPLPTPRPGGLAVGHSLFLSF